MKLSIIVPVYNVEKYLDKCLDSLVHQTIDDYEVIIVNDGTKDNSQSIIDKYKDEYPNIIKSYITENYGLGAARNYGMQYAKGEYITFLDSDDYVEKDLYEGMYNLAKSNDYDLVVGDLEYFWEDDENKKLYKNGLNKTSDNDIKSLFLSPLFAWNKLYKRAKFNELKCRYPEGVLNEDIEVSLRFFSSIDKVGWYNKLGYHYLQRASSIMGKRNDSRIVDIFKAFENVLVDFKQRAKFDEFHDELEYLFVEHFLVYGAFRFLRSDNYSELMTKAFSFVKKEFPNYKRNKYLSNIGFKNKLFLNTNNKLTMSLWHWRLTK